VVSGPSFWLTGAVLVLLTAAGLRYYLPLARRIMVEGAGRVTDSWVGTIDAAVAVVLTAWFVVLGRDALLSEGDRSIEFSDVVTGATVYGSIVLFLCGLLIYRNLRLTEVFGLGVGKFFRLLGTSLLALGAAYPLLLLVQAMIYGVAGGDMQPQEVVRFLQEAESPRDKLAVMVMAVIVAPVAEEVIFRGYLYPVAKRYAGAFVSIMVTSLLFAVLHGHAASVPALFTLAVCLALAYEKSGTLLVPMIMHAVFNAVSIAGIMFLL
jgi:membrane protease YdiL (CAAX protease family)